MPLLKKCSHCSEKGLFLKLTNGLCDNCNFKLKALEADYTKVLQKIALNPIDKTSAIKDLNILIANAKPFDGISTISVSTYNNLLSTLCEDQASKQSSTLNKNFITDKKTQIPPNNIMTKSLKFNFDKSKKFNVNPKHTMTKETVYTNTIDIETIITPKIKNLIEPVTEDFKDAITINNETSQNLKLNVEPSKSIPLKKATTINLNLQSSSTKNPVSCSLETVNIKNAFIINNLEKKCSLLISKLENPNITIDSIAENYFYIKNTLIPSLNMDSTLINKEDKIQKALENAKKTLCIRSKKTENELFDFFNYVTIFIQTTGLSPKNSDIIEISALKISYGKITDKFYSLVNPIKSIKLSVTNSTGISNQDVEDQPTIDMILPSLIEFIGNHQLIAFNAKPVDSFINSTLINLNMQTIKKPLISSMNLYRIRYKNFHGYPPALSDISNACLDLLPQPDIDYINTFNSFSTSSAHAIYKLYEILKYRYK